jgi:hypothetical protein
MSVIFSMLSKTSGVVASDSICFPPSGGVTFDCDKTFWLNDYPIVGAYCGLLEFSGLSVPEHISAILESKSFGNLKQIIDFIQQKLCDRLSKSGYCDSKVEILLVGRDFISRGQLAIGAIDIAHKLNNKSLFRRICG